MVERSADNGEVSCSSQLRPTILSFIEFTDGDVAQLVEHPLCKRRVSGSTPLISTIFFSYEIVLFRVGKWSVKIFL